MEEPELPGRLTEENIAELAELFDLLARFDFDDRRRQDDNGNSR